MEKTCVMCGDSFDGRADARFCTPKCRKIGSRLSATGDGRLSVTKDDLSVTKLSVTCGSVTEKLSVTDLMLIDPNDPKVIEEGLNIADEKKREMKASKLPEVTLDVPCKTGAERDNPNEVYLDLEKDLGLNLKKDLGIFAWSRDGIFIRPDITIQQVRNIRRIVEAKHGWPHRTYEEMDTPYSTTKVGVGL